MRQGTHAKPSLRSAESAAALQQSQGHCVAAALSLMDSPPNSPGSPVESGPPSKQIDLLREHRARLIADVVTGNLDVGKAAARLPEHIEEPEQSEDEELPEEADKDSGDVDPALTPEESNA